MKHKKQLISGQKRHLDIRQRIVSIIRCGLIKRENER